MSENLTEQKPKSFLDGVGNVFSKVATIFDNGLEIYTNSRERLRAAKALDDEVVEKEVVTIQQPALDDKKSKDNTLLIVGGTVGLLVAGIVIARMIK